MSLHGPLLLISVIQILCVLVLLQNGQALSLHSVKQAAKANSPRVFLQRSSNSSLVGSLSNNATSGAASKNKLMPHESVTCNDGLLGVTGKHVQSVFTHAAGPQWKQRIVANHLYPALDKKVYFIAACLHQNAMTFGQWSTELTKFILAIMNSKGSNVFVSIYESGSTDGTKFLLTTFGEALSAMGVRNRINLGRVTRQPRENRISFLAKVRNLAMDPIYEMDKTMHFDRIMWLNDVIFCAAGAVQQMLLIDSPQDGGSGADAACALDMEILEGECKFYDRWAHRDLHGHRWSRRFPFTQNSTAVRAISSPERLPFQVFSCWGGLVTFKADIFTKHRLMFRRNRPGECAASEAELIFHDMWKIGRGKVVVAPNSVTAYTEVVANRCNAGKQSSILRNQRVNFQSHPPAAVDCCPLDEYATYVNFAKCKMATWEDAYQRAGVPCRA